MIKFRYYLVYSFVWFGLTWFICFAWMVRLVDLICGIGSLIGLLGFRLVWITGLGSFVGSKGSDWFELKFEVP